MKEYGFGVDVGGTTIKMGLFQADGTLLEKWEIETNTGDHGKNVLPDIARSIDKKLTEKGIGRENVIGVGIGVPGPVKADGVVLGCVNLGWGVINVEKELSELCGMMVKAGNDANVAALGEMWQGGGKGTKDMLMVTLGTGVGGGVIVDGKVISGANGAGGEIGHFTVNKEELEPCNCGQFGCLEQYCSATGIVRMARKKLLRTSRDTALRFKKHLSSKLIFDEAKAGDQVAEELVDQVGSILGNALSNICVVTNPEVIVIGGGVSKAGMILIHAIQKHFGESCFHACRGTRFELAQLGNDAGIYGAMRQLLD